MSSRLDSHLEHKRLTYSYFLSGQATHATDAASQLASRLDQP